MPKKEIPSDQATDLRHQAENSIKGKTIRMPKNSEALSPEYMRQTLHELQVHQIELEMQNEELRQTQAELEASRTRYFDLYDLAPVGYFSLSKEGLIMEINLTAATMLGVARNALIKKPLTRFILPEDHGIYYGHSKLLFKTGAPQVCELRMRCADAAPCWVRIDAVAGENADGTPVCRATMIDITERKRIEQKLMDRTKRLDLAQSAANSGLWDWDVVTGHMEWSDQMFNLFGLNPQKSTASSEAWRSVLHPKDVEIAVQRIDKALKEQTRLNSDYRILLPDGQIRWINAVGDGEYDSQGRPVRMLGICMDITERKRSEEALQRSEERYRLLVESTNEAIVVVQDGKAKFVNREIEWAGYTREEYMSIPVMETVHPEDREVVEQRYLKKISGDKTPTRHTYRALHKSGRIHWIEVSATLIDWEERPATLNLIADITESKRVEEEIVRLRGDWESIFQGINHPTVILDPQYGIIAANKAVVCASGLSQEELLGKKCYEIFHGKDTAFPPKGCPMESLLASGKTETVTREMEAFGGVFLVSCTPIRNKHGQVEKIIHITTDITERKRSEEALQESERKYRIITEKMTDIVWIADMNLQTIYISPSVQTVLGFSQEERMRQTIDQQLAPDSLSCGLEAMAKELVLEEQGNHDPNRKVTLELEYYHKDGSTRWLETTINGLRDDQGVLTDLHGVARDITDRRKAEEELKESNALTEAVVENVPLMIFLKEATDLRFVIFNRAGEELLGYDRKDLMGKNNLDLFPPEQAAHFMAQDREVLDGEADVLDIPEEPIMTAKKGERFLHTRKVCIRGSDGTTKYLLGISEDITDRKQAEEAIVHSHNLMRYIIEHNQSAVAVHDRDLKYIYVSQQYLRDYGVKEKDVIGKHHYDVFPDLPQKWRDVHQKALTGEISSAEDDPYEREDGTVDWTRWECRPWYEANGSIGGIIIYTEIITKRKKTEAELKETLESLRKSFAATIQVMVSAVESRDPYTSGHQTRSADLARAIATEMELPQDKIEGLRMAGSIHDIGKLSIPAEILSKPTKLTNLEFSLIKEHSRKGYEMLKDVESPWPLAQIVYQHHERMDGSGYPRNLKGDEILIEARILAVADVVEAMASHRPYRPGLGIDAALNEIEKNRGIFYDEAVVDACLRLFREKGFKLEGT